MQCAKKGLSMYAQNALTKKLLDVGISDTRNSAKIFLQFIRSKTDKCKTEEEQDKKLISCRRPDLRKKPIPPYKYGFCKEAEVPMRMTCPPKIEKKQKGPCCHDPGEKKKGGCQVAK